MVMSPQYFRSDVIQDVDSSEQKKLCPDTQGKWMTYLLYFSAWKIESAKNVFQMYILRTGLFYPLTVQLLFVVF